MNPKRPKLFFGVVLIFVLTANPLRAQDTQSALSGTVTDSSGKVLPNAKVSVKNLSTGQSTETQADSAGHYKVPDLAAGDYEVSASAEGLGNAVDKVTLTAGSQQTLSLTLASAPTQQAPATPPAAAPAETLPSAPSASKTAPSLEDLGFSKTETQANAAQQALLDKRTHMLKMHQRFGLITTVPLLATLITSVNAGGKSTSTTDRNVHLVLGAGTGDLYGITATTPFALQELQVPKPRAQSSCTKR